MKINERAREISAVSTLRNMELHFMNEKTLFVCVLSLATKRSNGSRATEGIVVANFIKVIIVGAIKFVRYENLRE